MWKKGILLIAAAAAVVVVAKELKKACDTREVWHTATEKQLPNTDADLEARPVE